MFGKARLVGRIPIACTHYHVLPSALIKPKQPEILDSIHKDMKPMDYIGLYIIVTVSCTVSINFLYRLYF